VRDKVDRAVVLLRPTIGDGIGKGLSMTAEPVSAGVLPEADNVRVVPVGEDARGRVLRA
jgi:hypothetical protein